MTLTTNILAILSRVQVKTSRTSQETVMGEGI